MSITAGDWSLVHIRTGKPVALNELVFDFRGKGNFITHATPPHKPSSEGRVYARKGEAYYPSVFGLKWINGEIK